MKTKEGKRVGNRQRQSLSRRLLPPMPYRVRGELIRIGKPKAMRAVGSAIGANPISLLIPCHRVIRTNGKIGGYAWGTERKTRLLEIEKSA